MTNGLNLGGMDVSVLVAVGDRLISLLTQVKGKLVRQPDPALDKLAVVLIELWKTFEALEQAVTDYVSLLFDPTQPLHAIPNRQERRMLIRLEGGRTEAEMKKARGHCGKIESIYSRYLDRWFAGLLSKEEARQLKELFNDLHAYDELLINNIEMVAYWLTREARETNTLVSQRALEAANARLEQARKEILPFREQLSAAIGRLKELEAEFIRVSGALGS